MFALSYYYSCSGVFFQGIVLSENVWGAGCSVGILPCLLFSFQGAFLFFPHTGNASPKGQNYQLKLIHVNTTARLECADYHGPFLPQEALSNKELQGDRKATPLQSNLREVLKGLVGDEAKVRFIVDTIYGWQLGELPLPSWAHGGRRAQGRESAAEDWATVSMW